MKSHSRLGLLVLTIAVGLMTNSDLIAGHKNKGNRGSKSGGGQGGSYGSAGSMGGSGGSMGGSGGFVCGSGGCYASMGGSAGSMGSMGSYGSFGSSGSAGSAGGAPPVVSGPSATFILEVPEDAVVYLNSQRMTTEGTKRTFRVPVKEAGKRYRYEVKVEVERDGKKLAKVTKQIVAADKTIELAVTEPIGQTSDQLLVAAKAASPLAE